MRHPAYMQFDCREDEEEYAERYAKWKAAKDEDEIGRYEDEKVGRWYDNQSFYQSLAVQGLNKGSKPKPKGKTLFNNLSQKRTACRR